MRKEYIMPQTAIVLSLSDKPLMEGGWIISSSNSHGQAPSRFIGKKQSISTLYI